MSDTTSIEWTRSDDGTPGSTWNPLKVGTHRWYCEKISPGCDNCYASTFNRRMGGNVYPLAMAPAERDAAALPVLDEKALTQPFRWKKPRRIFVCSMTDLFGEWVPDEWLDRIYAVMALTPWHTYIVLTKRPKRMAVYLSAKDGEFGYGPRSRIWWAARAFSERHLGQDHYDALPVGKPGQGPEGVYIRDWPLPNVWAGVTIEEDRYAWRANYLRDTPAAVRWISAEPLLGGLPSLDLTGIDWLVAGGESGHHARPMHPDWARDLRDRCTAAGTAFFFKQWGAWGPTEIRPGGDLGGDLRKGTTVHLHAPGNPEGHFRPGDSYMTRVGNHRSGRLLDGREWNEYPAAAQVEVAS